MSDPFPTRQYPYRRFIGVTAGAAAGTSASELIPNKLYRYILGIDDVTSESGEQAPRILDQSQAAQLKDPFAQLLSKVTPHPISARALIAALDGTGLKRQSFFAGDGSQIPWSQATAHLARQIRTVVAWMNGSDIAVLLATAPPFDDTSIFLQVIGWDDVAHYFSFYERRLGAWIYAGSSPHAIKPPTRGRGPFDSHVNGALVMKELKAPWLHWSSSAAFEMPGISPDNPLRSESIFRERQGAEALERLVRSGIHRWTVARLDAADDRIQFNDVRSVLQHLLTATSVNLVSSAQTSAVRPADGTLRIPQTPFLDTHLLLDDLRIESDVGPPTAPWELYERMLVEHGYELRDEFGQLAAHGDAHFAFPAFERAEEDRSVVSEVMRRGLLSKRMVACLAMVDFPNPVASPRRAALLRHIPDLTNRRMNDWDLSDAIQSSILAAATPGSPEAEFAELWSAGEDWRLSFGRIIDEYLSCLQANLQTWDGFEAVARLIAFRRREASSRPLLEFKLTIPFATALPLQRLRMSRRATVEEY